MVCTAAASGRGGGLRHLWGIHDTVSAESESILDAIAANHAEVMARIDSVESRFDGT
jgi:hypothetical protein